MISVRLIEGKKFLINMTINNLICTVYISSLVVRQIIIGQESVQP